MPVAPRIVNDVSRVTTINDAHHFSWQGQHLVRLEGAPRIVNDVSYVTRIKDETLFTWQAQYLVRLEGDACCLAHCK